MVDWLKETFQENPTILLVYMAIFAIPLVLSQSSFMSRVQLLAIGAGIIGVYFFNQEVNKEKSPFLPQVDPDAKTLFTGIQHLKIFQPEKYQKAELYLNRFFELFNEWKTHRLSAVDVAKHETNTVYQVGEPTLLISNVLVQKAKEYRDKTLHHLQELKFWLPNQMNWEYQLEQYIKYLKTIFNHYLRIMEQGSDDDAQEKNCCWKWNRDISRHSTKEYVDMY